MPKKVNDLFSFIGCISLELYLVHIRLLKGQANLFTAHSVLDSVIRFLAFFIACVALSYILHYVAKKVIEFAISFRLSN